MEMLSLNNQIVSCRAIVKKAQVRIIRRKISKLKILRSCKKDDKEKKLKKAERIVEEILMLKKAKPDEVTKFALKNSDLDSILKSTPSNNKDHAYATLANFPELQKRVEAIKLQIPHWENELPKLLQQLGTRSLLKKWKRINQGLPEKPIAKSSKLTEDEEISEKPKSQSKVKIVKKMDKVEKKPKPKPVEVVVEKIPEPKVDDPFFVSKKVAMPKLLLNEAQENPGKEIKFSRDEPEPRRQFSKLKSNPMQRREIEPEVKLEPKELHPSWAAKKIKLIQPFEGKKIKFEDD